MTLAKLLRPMLMPIIDLVLDLFVWLVSFRPRPQPDRRSLIILRTDAIGDYLLFRAFLREIRAAYPHYHITLLGNIAYKSLCDTLDSRACDEYIWLDMAHFSRAFSCYKLYALRTLTKRSYTLLINPIHSRDKANSLLAKHINALEKVAPQGDCINLAPKLKARFDKLYTTLTPSTDRTLFEFYRNKEFFEALLHKHLDTSPKLPKHPFSSLQPDLSPPKPYALLFIGASAAYRKWSITHFAEVGIYLANTHKLHIAICGGGAERREGEALALLLRGQTCQQVQNLCARTSLAELGACVHGSSIVVSNETSCVHLAALLDIAVIPVSNGNHLGRFIPYPKEISDTYYPVFHPFIEQNPQKYEELRDAFAHKSELDINEITPQAVIEAIRHALTQS